MSDLPRKALRDLIVKYGTSLCSDVPRCRGLLRDFCGQHRRECNLLIHALETRVADELLASPETAPRQLLLGRLTKRMQNDFGFEEGLARWAVESWALALGKMSEGEMTSPEAAPASKPSPSKGGAKKKAATKTPAKPDTKTPAKPTPRAKPSGGTTTSASSRRGSSETANETGGESSGSRGGAARPTRPRPRRRTPSLPTTPAPLVPAGGGVPANASAASGQPKADGCAGGVAVLLIIGALVVVIGSGGTLLIPLAIGLAIYFFVKR